MRIRITKTPDPAEFVEFDVRACQLGEIIDVSPHLGTLLILAGNAEPVPSPGERNQAADGAPRGSSRRKQFS